MTCSNLRPTRPVALFTGPTGYCGNTKTSRSLADPDISRLLQFRICSFLLRSIIHQCTASWINWRIRSVFQCTLGLCCPRWNSLLTMAQYFKRSQIRPPSKIPSPGKGLSEISESDSNARSKPSAIPPPQMSAKLNGLPCEYNEL